MKVLDLHCSQHHSFEGWFASEDDFQSQLSRGLVTCPWCADTAVTKKLSAPRLNLTTTRGEPDKSPNRQAEPAQAVVSEPASFDSPSETLPTQNDGAIPMAKMQAALLQIARQVVANTEDVGASFPEEARKMHYGEIAPRHIRGQASAQETEALRDEGIAVLPLPLPELLKETLQ